jgi:hypothetical protein
MYLPPLLEALGLAELTHEKRNNTVRALPSGVAAEPRRLRRLVLASAPEPMRRD